MADAPSQNVTDDALPLLPIITSPEILGKVFTHRGVYGRPGQLFEDKEDDPAPDNEQLEHLGDTVLQLCATILIREMYPRLRVGPATKVRSEVVGNATLATLCVKYNLHTILRMQPVQALTLRKSTKVQADLFESYIGGVFVTRGLEVVQKWLFDVLRPSILVAYAKIRREYYVPVENFSSQSSHPEVDIVQRTLDSDFERMALEESFAKVGLLSPMNILASPPSSSSSPGNDHSNKGYLSLFNQYVQQNHLVIEWLWGDSTLRDGKEGPVWRCQLKVDKEILGEGNSRTKKAAMNEAAAQALHRLDVSL